MKQDTQNAPLEDALSRAYYYDENGRWRGPETDEWERWHAVAKVAAAMAAKPNAGAPEAPNVANNRPGWAATEE